MDGISADLRKEIQEFFNSICVHHLRASRPFEEGLEKYSSSMSAALRKSGKNGAARRAANGGKPPSQPSLVGFQIIG